MAHETLSATTTIDRPVATVFAVLADPMQHPAIEGTGWVVESLNPAPITEPHQVFRMTMFHKNHPDGHYQISNQVREFDPPHRIAWAPGTEDADGNLQFGGWIWRYDLAGVGDSQTKVTLSYDWSAATQEAREVFQFPPFGETYLDESLQHLNQLIGD